MTDSSSSNLSPNKQALLRIRQLKQQLADAQQHGSNEPIAIVSMACRFPRRATTPEKFWEMLIQQTDEVGDIPDDRWDLDAFHDDDPEVPGKMYARRGVFLDNIDQMDPEFFGISPREATWVDPQQRLLMEVGWEALERAGWLPEDIGDHTGIFVGWMHNDYQNEASDSFLNLNPYIATGAAGSFLCGRLAYYLGLQGPSVAVDTACSSSLVALHLAINSLQRGDCERALVGGVNAICSPTTNILTCKLKALSPNGHSRAFDAAADGYLRGEGCGVITLRRLSDAQNDSDPILGVIRGSAVGHNGFSSGLTAPNPQAQEKVIGQALQRAGISPADVAYLEAHGTGTELGDPIEMRAAAAALGDGRTKDSPLLVGSVKTNIGHLEAAAGMAGLIKVLLAMQNDEIPGQMNFETPNPHIPWESLPVEVLTDATAWPTRDRRIAGVSAFGMSGTNAHVVVEAPDRSPMNGSGGVKNLDVASTADSVQLITVSGRNEDALLTNAEQLADALQHSDGQESLAAISETTNRHRSHFEHRAAVVATNRNDAVAELRTIARGGSSESAFVASYRRPPRIAWQFTGQGSQYVGMGRDLYDSEPVFRAALDECDALLREIRGESLLEVLFAESNENAAIHNTHWTQPAIFALQMGLAKLLAHQGIQPDVVFGHSVGQYAAACVAGILTWEDGLKLIAERGRIIGELPQEGRMLAVFAPRDVVDAAVAEFVSGRRQDATSSGRRQDASGTGRRQDASGTSGDEVSIAAYNGTHIVVSGTNDAVDGLERQLGQRKIRTRGLQTSHAFHSSLMDPVLQPFAQFADQVSYSKPQIPFVCNVSGELLAADTQLDGQYWAQHIRAAVRFSDSVSAALQTNCELLLELGPQGTLTRMAAVDWTQQPGTLISCLQRDTNDCTALRRAIGQLYVRGTNPNFSALHGDAKQPPVLLPTYAFQRRRFWGPDKPRAFHAEYHTAHPLLGGKVDLAGIENETRYENFIEPDSPAWLPDHEVMNAVVLPGAAYLEMALAAAGDRQQIANVVFAQPLRPTSRTALQTIVRTAEDAQTIETHSRPANGNGWTKNFSARLESSEQKSADEEIGSPAFNRDELETALSHVIDPQDFYRHMEGLGLNYGPKFQVIQSLRHSESAVLARLDVQGDERGYIIPPTLLDGALHCLAVGLLNDDDDHLFLPVAIDRLICHQAIESTAWCVAKWNETDGANRSADLTLYSESGAVAVEIRGLQVQQVSLSALRKMSGTGADRLLFETDWEPMRLPGSPVKNTRWLIVDSEAADAAGISDEISGALKENGHSVVRVRLRDGAEYSQNADSDSDVGAFEFCGQDSANWTTLLNDVQAETEFDGIVWKVGWPGLERRRSETPDLPSEAQSNADHPADFSPDTRRNCSGLLNLINALLGRGQRQLKCGLQILTSDAHALADFDSAADTATTSPPVRPEQTQYWGLGRVIGAEQPELHCRLIDVSSAEQNSSATAQRATDILLTETADNQFLVRDEQFFVPRLRPVSAKRATFVPADSGCVLISGGLGMLGRLAAAWLVDRGASQLVLVSRREPSEEATAFLDSLRARGADIVVHCADISERNGVEQLFERFGNDLQELRGIIHAAGVLDDGLIESQTWERFARVLASKISAARLLDEFSRGLSLDFFVLYSSAASVLGSPGQSNYATGNAFLDGLAFARRAAGLPALSVNWGPWVAGMADDERILKRLKLQGITPLDVDEAHAALEVLLTTDRVQATVMDVDWRRMRTGPGGEIPPLLSRLVDQRKSTRKADSAFVSKLRQLQGAAQRELLVSTVQNSLQEILNTPDAPDTDRPLIEMGLDSLMAVEFGTELQQLLGDQFAVGPTMLFDHPTIDAISDHVLELVTADSSSDSSAETTDAKSKSGVNQPTQTAREDVAIIGMSCRFPGAKNIDEFWDNLMNGVDSVCDIPNDRWDVDRFYSVDREPGKMYVRAGGFLEDIADFDAEFFNIADQEACWIDPQHRMLLENSYHALEHAGIPTQPLPDSSVGVFMGIMGQDYAFLPTLDDDDVIRGFQGAGLSHSAGVGRISYVFGFEGPSVAVDTASSSSLVALFQAVRSLQDGNCNLALAGGVNAILAPVNSLLMSKAGLLSDDGRCKSFSAAASGFGRGEGCGVVVLKRLSDAQRDGDRVLAVVRGGAVVHNGFSGGITSPNSKAQGRVITDALNDAGLAPSEVQYLEAHGTGTEYGDPMELTAAAKVYGKGRRKDAPLLVGSVKANISHLEAAGGSSGLIKTVLSLHHGIIPPQIHFEEPSPHIPWRRLPVKMVTEPTPWPDCDERRAGITALGLVGTNAHVVLSAAVHKDEGRRLKEEGAVCGEQILTVSARSDAALKQLVDRYRQRVQAVTDEELADICFTANTGRRQFEERAAFCFSSRDELLPLLDAFELYGTAEGPNSDAGMTRGCGKTTPKIAWTLPDVSFDPKQTLAWLKELEQQETVVSKFLVTCETKLQIHADESGQAIPSLRKWLEQAEPTDGEDSTSDGFTAPPQAVCDYLLQAAVAQVWRDRGLLPDVVLGFGTGQFIAAALAGCVCFFDALLLIWEASRIDVEQQSVANSDPGGAESFETFADTFNFYPPKLPLICSHSGELVPVHKSLGGSYWRDHIVQPTANSDATLQTLADQGCEFHLAIGGPFNAENATSEIECVQSLPAENSTNSSITRTLNQATSQLYVAGANLNFGSLYADRGCQRVSLPYYPFQKKRYWITEIAQHLPDKNAAAPQTTDTSPEAQLDR